MRSIHGVPIHAAALCALFSIAWGCGAQEPVHWEIVQEIRSEGFERSNVMEYALYLSDVVGPRLTASPNMREAQHWLMEQMEAIGLESVELEPWGDTSVGWEIQRVSIHMLEPDYQMVIGYPLAYSSGTGGPVIERALIVDIRTPEDMEQYRGQIRNAIVLSTPTMPLSPRFAPDAFRHTEESLHYFETEGQDYLYELHGRGQPGQGSFSREGVSDSELEEFFAAEGVAAVLTAARGSDGTVMATGRPGSRSNRTRAAIEASPPTLAIAAEHYNRIYRILERGIPVTMEVDVRVGFDETDTRGYNLLAEIPGTDLAHEVVGIGGHLDTWHTSTGATDNAAGVAVATEAMRILKAIGVRPRRTIRIMLWSYEEGGLRGSRGYVRNHLVDPEGVTTPEYDDFSVYFNMDNGTGQFRGVHMQGNPLVAPIFSAWMESFHDLEVKTLSQFSNRGTDHLSFDQAGLPGFQFVQDRIDYRARTHHFNMDVADKLLPRDLQINAIVMASFAYHAAMRDEKIPRKPVGE